MSSEQKMPKKKFSLKNNYGIKLLIVVVLILFFMIPLAFIKGLVSERIERKNEVESDIVSSWGGSPRVAGPILIVPYLVKEKYYNDDTKKYEYQDVQYDAFVLPETLNLDIDISAEERHRGIYTVPVYTVDINAGGFFSLDELLAVIDKESILFDEIKVVVALSEAKGITEISDLKWKDEDYAFRTGTGSLGLFYTEIEAAAPFRPEDTEIGYSYNMKLKGGRFFELIPVGDDTKVSMKSDWAAPSFFGEYLPLTRDLREDGFTAEWSINALSRTYPSLFIPGVIDSGKIIGSSFGVQFFDPVNQYLKNERSVKYGFLFILIPFLTFVLFELLLRRKIHPVQYFLAGAGNIVFYLLLLSLSEHLGFNWAYLIAAVSVTVLLSAYAGMVIQKSSKGLIMGAVLSVSYLYLFSVLQSEDYALLFGSIGLFAAVALVMFLTRKIKWYNESE